MDRLSKRERSALMASIRGDSLRPEAALKGRLGRMGLRFSANDKSLPGSPDIAFRRRKLAVFVHGCFWHGCHAHYRKPKTNRAFWASKAESNRRRDARARRRLNRMGWRTMVVWEHEIRGDAAGAAERVAKKARPRSWHRRIKAHERDNV